MIVQVYLYTPQNKETVSAKAMVIDKNAEMKNFDILPIPIPINPKVEVQLKIEGIDFEDNRKTIVWMGNVNSCTFNVFIPSVEGFRIAKAKYFYDRDSLKAGDMYRKKIEEAIHKVDTFVLCWSKNAAESPEVAYIKSWVGIAKEMARFRTCGIFQSNCTRAVLVGYEATRGAILFFFDYETKKLEVISSMIPQNGNMVFNG